MVKVLPLLVVLGCGNDATDAAAGDSGTVTEQIEPVDPTWLLSRVSLDFRQRRPTAAELERIEADPDAIEEMIGEFLEDPAFEDQIVSWYADVWKTRADSYITGADGEADLYDEGNRARFLNAVGEEPLRIIARIAKDDLPYTDIVTADWTMVNDELIGRFPVELLEEGEGWVKAEYTDGRPAAGIMTSNGVYWRYTSTVENVNRGRARALLEYLLCDNRFDAVIDFDTNADEFDSTNLNSRAAEDPACVSCHVVIDPMGSHLWGYWRHHPESYSEALRYYPGREDLWETMTGFEMSFYGQPTDSLWSLGRAMAADPRIVSCPVRQGFAFMHQREYELADVDEMNENREDFIDGGLTLKALFASLSRGTGYRTQDSAVGGDTVVKRTSPEQYARSVEAISGYRWTASGGVDMMINDTIGVRVLAGGADGVIVTQPATDHAATSILVQERLAEVGAVTAVATEQEMSAGERTLLTLVEPDEVPDDATLRTQIQHLIWTLHGRRAADDDADLAALESRWTNLNAESGDPAESWALLISALLRHPDFVHY